MTASERVLEREENKMKLKKIYDNFDSKWKIYGVKIKAENGKSRQEKT